MNTSSAVFEALTAELGDFPQFIAALSARLNGPWKELTVDRLAQGLTPAAAERLPWLILRLTSSRVVKPVYRVESDEGGGIKDYETLLAIPEEVEDWRTGQLVRVSPARVRLVLTKPEP
jgi:hypothetical protein